MKRSALPRAGLQGGVLEGSARGEACCRGSVPQCGVLPMDGSCYRGSMWLCVGEAAAVLLDKCAMHDFILVSC